MNARFTARTAFVAAGLALSTTNALAQDYFWENPIGGTWSTAALWGPEGVPNGAGQSATINATGAAYIVTLDMAATLDDFLLDSDDATLLFAGQTLTFNNQGVFNRGKTWFSGGGLAGNTAINRSEFLVRNTVTFSLNSFTNEGDLTVLGIPGGTATLALGATNFANTGTVNLNSTSNGAAAITGTGTLTNDGAINIFEGSGTSRTLSINSIENNGDINISANTTFNGLNGATTTSPTGSFNTANGFTATFNNGHDFVLNGGTVNNLGGLELTGSGTTFVFNGGSITGNNPVIRNAALVTTASGTGSIDMLGNTTLQSDAAPGLNINVRGTPGTSATMNMGASNFVNNAVVSLNSTSNGTAAITGTGTLTNNGTLNSFEGSGTSRTLSINSIENNGDINISANTTFNGPDGATTTSSTGSFNTANGFTATFNNGHDFVLNGGTFNNLGGLELTGSGTTFVFNGGSITGNNPVVRNAALVTTGAGTGALDMLGNTTLQSDAAPGLNINVLGAPGTSATMNMGASNFVNNAIVTLNSTSNGTAAITGTGTLTNNGTMNSLFGSGTSRTLTINSILNNGDINISANTTFNGPGGATVTSATGSFNTTNGFTATFNNGHDFVLNGGSINNLGALEINGANAIFTFNGGSITGNNPRIVNAGLITTAAGTGSIDMLGNTTLQSDAAPGLNINVRGAPGTSATMNMGASNFVNNAIVNLDSTSNGSAAITGIGTLTNNGTINSLLGPGTSRTLTIDSILNNGDINISANTAFNGPSGTTTTSAAGSFNTANTFTATFSSGQDFVLNGGTVNNEGAIVISGTNSRLTLNGGDITGNAIEVRGGRLATTAPTTGHVMVTGGSILESDLASGLNISIMGVPGSSANLVTGVADITNHAALTLDSVSNGNATLLGTGNFTNANTLSVLPGSGTSRTISVADFNNEGDFFAHASVSLNLADGTFNNTGNLFIAPSAIVTIGGTGTQTLDNTIDGIIAGDGTLDLRFTEVFINDGIFDPQGSLRVLGAWHQSELGGLAIEIGGLDSGINYDLLNITLGAVLDGDLIVTLANGFNPSPTDVFTVLTASSVSGIFANGATTVQTADGFGTFDVVYNAGSVQLTNYIPAPGTAAMLALGGLVAARRRRS